MISIIIPVWNQAGKIGQCLDSILAQTRKDYEVIVVNDGSTDNIRSVLESYSPKFEMANKKLLVIHQENAGSNAARNRGAEEAWGDLLIFCDADVVMKPKMLELMKDELDYSEEASFAYCSFYWGRKLFRLWPYNRERLKEMPCIHTTSLIRKCDFPGFDVKVKRLQDWDLWLTMMERGLEGVWIDKPLFKVIDTRATMSSWLPSFVYKLFPFLPAVKKYKQSIAAIRAKHGLV